MFAGSAVPALSLHLRPRGSRCAASCRSSDSSRARSAWWRTSARGHQGYTGMAYQDHAPPYHAWEAPHSHPTNTLDYLVIHKRSVCFKCLFLCSRAFGARIFLAREHPCRLLSAPIGPIYLYKVDKWKGALTFPFYEGVPGGDLTKHVKNHTNTCSQNPGTSFSQKIKLLWDAN